MTHRVAMLCFEHSSTLPSSGATCARYPELERLRKGQKSHEVKLSIAENLKAVMEAAERRWTNSGT